METMTITVGYASRITEYEAGWGSRDEGYIIAGSVEALKQREDEFEKNKSYELFYVMDNPIKIALNKEGIRALTDRPYIWVDHLSTYGERL